MLVGCLRDGVGMFVGCLWNDFGTKTGPNSYATFYSIAYAQSAGPGLIFVDLLVSWFVGFLVCWFPLFQ